MVERTPISKTIKVAKVVDGYKVILNAGSHDGIRLGQDFIIYRSGGEIVDPDTKESLEILEEVIGRGAITHLQEKLSTLEASEMLDGGRRIIRRNSPANVILGLSRAFAETEEVFEVPDKIRPFRKAQVGDSAKPT